MRFSKVFSSCSSAALLATAAVGVMPANAETPQILARSTPVEPVSFDVYLPLRDKAGLEKLAAEQVREGSPQYHAWLTPKQVEARFGATPAAWRRVEAELRGQGFTTEAHQGQLMHITGNAALVERAFGVQLNHSRFAEGFEALVADRALTMTPAIYALGGHIAQFTTVPPAHKDSHLLGPVPLNFKSALGPYLTADLRQAYDFPTATSVNGRGVTIGILMSNNFQKSDIDGYFEYEGAKNFYPPLTSIPINGGAPFSSQDSVETHLDIEQSAGIALGASVILYDLSDLSDPVIQFGLNRIVSDNKVDVVNMSFGGLEVGYEASHNGGIDQSYELEIYDELFLQGNSQGITFVASSGDHGANPLAGGKRVKSVETPAADPHVTAVGGTNLVTSFTSGKDPSVYRSEFATPDPESGGNIWGSGGGVSVFFAKPSYQKLITTPSTVARTVPDIALHMGGCPSDATDNCGGERSSDIVAIGDNLTSVIGTSASSPDIAGMFALKVKLTNSRLGNENADIYTRAKAQIAGGAKSFHHAGIAGSNGLYSTKTPYDLVIGTGTVDARVFLGKTNLPASGNIGTAGNP